MSSSPQELDFESIKAVIPQRFPFMMLDKVKELEPGVRAVGVKNVTGNEWFFQGHFPKRAITPGAMISEGVAQTGIVFFHYSQLGTRDVTYYLASLKMRFLIPVLPGDRLEFRLSTVKLLSDRAIFAAEVVVEDRVVAKGEIALVAKPNTENP